MPNPRFDVPTDLRVAGSAVVYRLYDIGYEVHLDRVQALLPSDSVARTRPTQHETQALLIRNPPVTVALGVEPIVVDGQTFQADASARIFDFGVVSLRLRVGIAPGVTWRQYVDLGIGVDVRTDLTPLFTRLLTTLVERIGPAIVRPAIASVTEDYVVFRITSLLGETGPVSGEVLTDDDVAGLLLDEQRPLSAAARKELLPHRFSYYGNDVSILTWNNALVVDEALPEEADIQFVLEFANAQLLELRVYDDLLDNELPRLNARVAEARARRWRLPRSYAAVLGDLQTLLADSTELVERVENSFKVTDDVYLARVYGAAIEVFRGRTWRQGIDRKLGILRDTYGMLHAESQASRAEGLEIAIVLLIVLELLTALVWK